ncbi:MAG: hypothetical protein GDA56_11715 [Hormoscilla sp. GM7CHS1pb]|nr:hypothetical protein [Hormoscilla sp. GM7CHS1pb]
MGIQLTDIAGDRPLDGPLVPVINTARIWNHVIRKNQQKNQLPPSDRV